MDSIRDYVLSVSYAALICGIVGMLVAEKSASSKLVKLLSGIFLATVILKPVIRFDLSDLEKLELTIKEKREEAVAEGERLAWDSISEKAAFSAQTLIEQEAEKLGCQLEVTVCWEDQSPQEITLKGTVSPYAKNKIAQWITENMGLPQEAQTWIG